MSDVHKEIREAWEQSEYGTCKLEYHYGEGGWRQSVPNPAWRDVVDYRMVNKAGAVVMQSNGKPASTDYELTATDYADGCCKAALSLLMKPSREPEDIRKALAWLTLAVGGQR